MKNKVRKAVFPVAGLGTRFLPVTKASAKEMLPIVDKPLIQYAVEEAVDAGIDSIVFINGKNKRAIEDHFDSAPELELELERKGKTEMLKAVREIVPSHVSCIYLRQATPLGLGHAILCAEPAIGDEPFVILLADDLVGVADGEGNCVSELIKVHEEYGTSVVAVEEVSRDSLGKYGVVGGEPVTDGVWRVTQLVEKPKPEESPSNLAIMGRYLLKPGIFDHLRRTDPGVGGELQLTDAIDRQVRQGDVLAYLYRGTRYDCGSKLGYLAANVEVGIRDPRIGSVFRDYLRKLKL